MSSKYSGKLLLFEKVLATGAIAATAGYKVFESVLAMPILAVVLLALLS